jgi:hypothetical protein
MGVKDFNQWQRSELPVMALSGKVEIADPLDNPQGKLEAKSRFVMPAEDGIHPEFNSSRKYEDGFQRAPECRLRSSTAGLKHQPPSTWSHALV